MEKTPKMTSIVGAIDFGKSEALNAESDQIRQAFGCGGSIKSNADEPELIIHITFKEKVNLTGINLECHNSGNAPSEIQLFSNKTNIGFSDIGTVPSTESISKFTVGKLYNLKIAKYRNIDTLVLYVSNPSGSIVELTNVDIFGVTAENTDMSQMKNTNP